MIDFLPVFIVRGYYQILWEGTYKIILTHFDKYILDDISLVGDFLDRRLQLKELQISKSLPYKVYKLNKQIKTIEQLLNCKHKTFITLKGNIIKWKKLKYYNITIHKVVSKCITRDGKYNLITKALSPYISSVDYNYLATINYKGSNVIIRGFTSYPERIPKRIKL